MRGEGEGEGEETKDLACVGSARAGHVARTLFSYVRET